MPTDNNGNFSLPTGYLAVTGQIIEASQHNPPLEDIAEALSGRLPRNGAAPMTGPLKAADGTVGAPAITFANAPTTGFYKTSTGFAVAIAGVKVAEFIAGGIKGARVIGELVPFTGFVCPPLFVFPYGQNLSRTAYPDLWTFAQAQIAAGAVFYNNGNGSTTFGVGDLRCRVPAGLDTMGGVSSGRFNNSSMISVASLLGAAAGVDAVTLAASAIPAITSSNAAQAISVTSANLLIDATGVLQDFNPTTASGFRAPSNSASLRTQISSAANSISVTSNNTGGGSHLNVQPTMMLMYILFAGA